MSSGSTDGAHSRNTVRETCQPPRFDAAAERQQCAETGHRRARAGCRCEAGEVPDLRRLDQGCRGDGEPSRTEGEERAGPHHGVQDERDGQRDRDGAGNGPLRIAHLLAHRGDARIAREGEEQQSGSLQDTGHAAAGPLLDRAQVVSAELPTAEDAGLMAGNSVVAKPAEQTPLIAAEAVRWARPTFTG